MPSDLIVEVCKIDEVKPHDNAEKLEVSVIKGWQVIVPKGQYKAGDTIVYFPPDTLVSEILANALGVAKYLSIKDGFGRVRSIKLRQLPSHGFAATTKDIQTYMPNLDLPVGRNVADVLGCKKWEPPEPKQPGPRGGKAVRTSPIMYKYTDIQNYRHYPDIFEDRELVVVTEKIHGSNLRTALLRRMDRRWYKPWTWFRKYEWACGSNNVQRDIRDAGIYSVALKDDKMTDMLLYLWKTRDIKEGIIVYGEVFGANIQDLKYGRTEIDYAVFDIAIDGQYQNWKTVRALCTQFNVPTVPELYRGPYSKEKIKSLVDGNTLMMDKEPHIREGIVIKPEIESTWRNGRKILKYVSDAYLTRKDGTENH